MMSTGMEALELRHLAGRKVLAVADVRKVENSALYICWHLSRYVPLPTSARGSDIVRVCL